MYFTEPGPADLRVGGVAILAFSAVNRRLVAVPIQQSLRKTPQEGRQLQAVTADDASSSNRDFDLQVGLAKQTADVQQVKDDNGLMLVVVGIVVLILIVVIALVCCCFVCIGGAKKRNKGQDVEQAGEDFAPVTTNRSIKHQKSGRATVVSQQSQASLNNAHALQIDCVL